jgi:methylated-DNA-protein-cysteine methyltransferase related protein
MVWSMVGVRRHVGTAPAVPGSDAVTPGQPEVGAPPGSRVARVIERVRAIPEGFVRTYADIDPAAPRLVGRVLATTHEEVPWHRVVRSDGSVPIGAKQVRLLRREGVPFRGERVDLARARIPD